MNVILSNSIQSVGVDSMSVLMTFLTFLAFAIGWAVNRISILRIRKNSARTKELSTIMQHTLNTSNNYVLRLNLVDRYAVNMHGDFLPPEGMGYEESLNYIHPDDRILYRDFLIRLLNGAKTSETIFRWDRSLGKHEEDWCYIRDVGIAEYANANQDRPINFFCTLTDQTEQVLKEKEEHELTDRYRRTFDQSIVGLAFYDDKGNLLTANKKMREILKFQSEDDPYYYQSTIFDKPYFRDILHNHQAEELHFCTKTVIIERGVNCYTEMQVHPINDEKGQLLYITFSIRDITEERNLYLENKKNDEAVVEQSQAIERYEQELQYLMENCDMRFFRINAKDHICTFYKTMKMPEIKMTLKEVMTHFVDSSFIKGLKSYEQYFNVPRTELTRMRPFFHESKEMRWNFIESIPSFDEKGHFTGTYGIVRNVTPLIEKQELLKEETERANQSGLRKSTFMANMTHEIRTPLNAIVGFSDVLPMMSTPEEKREIIHVIMNNCDMLLRLVNDVLAVSDLDNNGIEIFPSKTDFVASFNDIATSLAQRVQMPGVAFLKESPLTKFITILDSGRIQQVITNFVTNAIKYTQQGHIKIGYELQHRNGKNGLYLYCEDTGTGIPKEAQAKVFDRFVKLNDYVQGTGLGLSICKAIADSCHGDIGVFSEGNGKGSTFWFWLPCEEITENE